MKLLNTLKDMEKELYLAIRTTLTGDALEKFKNEEVAWEYYFMSNGM